MSPALQWMRWPHLLTTPTREDSGSRLTDWWVNRHQESTLTWSTLLVAIISSLPKSVTCIATIMGLSALVSGEQPHSYAFSSPSPKKEISRRGGWISGCLDSTALIGGGLYERCVSACPFQQARVAIAHAMQEVAGLWPRRPGFN